LSIFVEIYEYNFKRIVLVYKLRVGLVVVWSGDYRYGCRWRNDV